MNTPIKMPDIDVPLYSHPLMAVETWLIQVGCQQDSDEIERWFYAGHEHGRDWDAELRLEEGSIWVRYTYAGGNTKTLTFPYSISRKDAQLAIFDV